MQNSSNVGKEEVVVVNTKNASNKENVEKRLVNPSKNWRFTLNNYTKEDVCAIVLKIEEFCEWAVIGKEVSSTGTPHLQGALCFKNKTRFTSRISIVADGVERIRSFINKANGRSSQQVKDDNVKYCSKEELLFAYNVYVPKKVKTINEDQFYDWEKELMEIIKQEPNERTIHWRWSENGGVGKTSFQKYLCVHHNAIILGGKAADCKNGICEYVKTNGETPRLIVVNIPRSFSSDYISYEAFENIKDMCFYSGKYEGGMVVGNSPHLIIFANVEPNKDKMSFDRWDISQID